MLGTSAEIDDEDGSTLLLVLGAIPNEFITSATTGEIASLTVESPCASCELLSEVFCGIS